MMQEFITALMAKISQHVTAYYDEAPADALFPYTVVTTSSLPLDFGDSVTVFVTHWAMEGAGSAVAIEAQCDTLRTSLDSVSINVPNKFNSYIRYENQKPIVDQIQDYIIRQQEYSARVFFLRG